MNQTSPGQSEFVNLMYGFAYLLGALALVVPPLGVLLLFVIWRSHKNYRSTRLPSRPV